MGRERSRGSEYALERTTRQREKRHEHRTHAEAVAFFAIVKEHPYIPFAPGKIFAGAPAGAPGAGALGQTRCLTRSECAKFDVALSAPPSIARSSNCTRMVFKL